MCFHVCANSSETTTCWCDVLVSTNFMHNISSNDTLYLYRLIWSNHLLPSVCFTQTLFRLFSIAFTVDQSIIIISMYILLIWLWEDIFLLRNNIIHRFIYSFIKFYSTSFSLFSFIVFVLKKSLKVFFNKDVVKIAESSCVSFWYNLNVYDYQNNETMPFNNAI